PIGTGPYKMSARVPKQSLDFVPVDNWWGSPKPVLKKIHVDIIADLSQAIAKCDQTGFDNVGFGDMNGNVPPEDILRIKAGPKSSELKFIPKVRTTWVGFNYEKGPFAGAAGKDLRKAFSLAIDRSKLVDVACSHGITCAAATERETFFQRRTKKEYTIFRHSWQADYDHPQDWFDNLFITDAGNGGTGYSNPQLDALVKTADAKKTEDAIADYKKASQLMID